METPVFRLEGVFKTQDEASDFEGPLALILQLLSKNKIEIRDISISLILDQYLEYLDAMAELDLDIASEFVAMASYLTYIKTKMLLSEGEEVTELSQLISSLEDLQRNDIYTQVKSAAQTLSGMYSRYGMIMAGPPEFIKSDSENVYSHFSVELLEAVLRVINREDTFIGSINRREATYPSRIVFSIPDKISEILELLKRCGDLPLSGLFGGSGSRAELVATLIAVLELCRVGGVLLTGDADDMVITYTGTGRDPATPEMTYEEYN